MDRGAKTAKANAATRRPVARKPRDGGATRIRELEAHLAAAREQQAATNEILRLMASSPGNVQPVLDAVAAQAAGLCNAPYARVFLVDGDVLRSVADHSVDGEAQIPAAPVPLKRSSISGRAVLDRDMVHHADIVPLLDSEFPDARDNVRRSRSRAVLAVPLIREGGAYGAIFLWRRKPGLFAPDQVALVQTFARQAAIAVENVRLFTELGARNRDLTEALEQQTATSEILRAISSSPTNVQPVFDIIAESAGKLCGAEVAVVSRFDGTAIELAAIHGVVPEGVTIVRKLYPMSIDASTITARVIRGSAVVHIADVLAERDYGIKDFARAARYRGGLGVPIVKGGEVIGSIFVGRAAPGRFTDPQVELLKTFSEQAVIAIENVRLFTELGARNRDLTEALEQQTATSEILRVISGSQTDAQPVFDTIVENAVRLCGADFSYAARFDGKLLHPVAFHGFSPDALEMVSRKFPMRPSQENILGRVALNREVVHLPDVLADPDYSHAYAIAGGWRSLLGVPMLRDGVLIGAIGVGRTVPGFYPEQHVGLLKTFADQAVIAIENVRLFTELGDRNRDLTEALEQQTATSEILRVISGSPTDVQPVFDTIAQSALTLCRASSATMLTFDGELIHLASVANVKPEASGAIRALFPRPPSRDTVGTRAILTRSVVIIPDVLEDSDYSIGNASHFTGFRGVMAVPLIRDDVPIGAIAVGRPEPGPFSEKQIALLRTFADQAVIAVENVRLFTELGARNKDLTESLEQQTATSEILRAISSSPTDVQPVFDIIGESAERLCDAEISVVSRTDGELIRLVALHGVSTEGGGYIARHFPMRLDAETVTARAIRRRAVIHVADALADPDYESKDAALAGGYRACLGVPMFREGEVIGAIFVARKQAGLYTDSQVQLLRTFADQAVIAIENVRLFTELGARNRDLTEALEQQVATSDILRVISQSQTNVQPVFDTIVAAALKLCNAGSANVFTFDGESIHLAAFVNVNRQYVEALRAYYPRPPGRDTAVTRAILTRDVVMIPDVDEDREYPVELKSLGGGFRSILAVPLIREGHPIGGIAVGRFEPGPFPDTQVELLKTFADQAVIAIENVRLFKELDARTTELIRSVSELKALGDVGRAVGSTLDLETVLSTIVSRATELAGMDGGAIYEYDETKEQFYLHTAERYAAELVDVLRAKPIRKGEGALGRLAVVAEPVQIRNIADDRTYKSRVREILLRLGYRSLLAIPLLREDRLLGGLIMNRKTAGEFAPQVIELLKTFASQSALAIQNARLFREIEDKGRQLEIASRHKSEFLANMSHELRTPLNAIIGFSEVLSERMFGEVNDKQAEYLTDILESGRHLLSLINDILDLSKIEAGRMELEPSEFNLPGAIDNTLTLLRERAQRRDVRLGREFDETVGTVRADERKVKQVLLNLLSNALKFTPDGGRIDVKAIVRNNAAEISVTDTGVGIAPGDLEAVFEEFRQVGTSAKKVEGTGLGLAISRKFIELHGGRIWATSELGAGSTFTFTLPR